MDDLLPYYERELGYLLGGYSREYAKRHARTAARLGIRGDHVEDPNVGRLIESAAFFNARIHEKLEDEYPEFTETLLTVLFPQYLRPFPSCSIAQFEMEDEFESLTEPRIVRRGMQFTSNTGGYLFRSAYDVVLAPLRITQMRYVLTPVAPIGLSLPAGSTGLLSITFAPAVDTSTLAMVPGRVRTHLSGQREVVAALLDGLLLRAAAAYVEPDGLGVWKRLPQLPLTAVGFEASEALLGGAQDPMPVMRSLLEYFSFPDRFDFVDIDFDALRRGAGSCRWLTLHLAITGTPPDSQAAQRMATVTADNLKLFCTPMVNLFSCDAVPIETREAAQQYAVVPQTRQVSDSEIWSVDAVRMTPSSSGGEISVSPWASLRHGNAVTGLPGPYWMTRRDSHTAQESPGYETEIALVGLNGAPMPVETKTALAVDLTCSNRNLPSSLRAGTPGATLSTQAIELPCPVMLLSRPTQSGRRKQHGRELWRLISYLTPQALQLSSEGLEDLKRFLRQFVPPASVHARCIDGIADIGHRPVMQWVSMEPHPAFARGIEIKLVVDEPVFAIASLSIFVSVMDNFFSLYAPATGFMQLIVISANTGVELKRCVPRLPQSPLL
jgi:type VI secretion system protein ImpG